MAQIQTFEAPEITENPGWKAGQGMVVSQVQACKTGDVFECTNADLLEAAVINPKVWSYTRITAFQGTTHYNTA